jgi:hypothetical protein
MPAPVDRSSAPTPASQPVADDNSSTTGEPRRARSPSPEPGLPGRAQGIAELANQMHQLSQEARQRGLPPGADPLGDVVDSQGRLLAYEARQMGALNSPLDGGTRYRYASRGGDPLAMGAVVGVLGAAVVGQLSAPVTVAAFTPPLMFRGTGSRSFNTEGHGAVPHLHEALAEIHADMPFNAIGTSRFELQPHSNLPSRSVLGGAMTELDELSPTDTAHFKTPYEHQLAGEVLMSIYNGNDGNGHSQRPRPPGCVFLCGEQPSTNAHELLQQVIRDVSMWSSPPLPPANRAGNTPAPRTATPAFAVGNADNPNPGLPRDRAQTYLEGALAFNDRLIRGINAFLRRLGE